MSAPELVVTRKKVNPALVAGLSFAGQYSELPGTFARLHEQVKPYINGRAICAYSGRNTEGTCYLETCYPVSQPVDSGEVRSRVLEDADVFVFRYTGPRDTPKSVLKDALDYLNRHDIAPGLPLYILFQADGDEFRDSTEEFEVEIQIPPKFSSWLKCLSEGVARFAGETASQKVMVGSETIVLEEDPDERIGWQREAIGRLDAEVSDLDSRRRIMRVCSDPFPKERIDEMRELYQRLGSIDALLVHMLFDSSWYNLSWYEYPQRVGNTIYTTKIPFDPEGYKNATTSAERRASYCHCGLIRPAIRKGETLPLTHCYCGAGWYNQLWEGVLGQPVEVEIVRAVAQGADCCTFAIHLPLSLDD